MSDITNKERAWELFLEGNKLADQKHIEKAIALYVFDPNGKVILTRDMTLDYDV